MSYSWPNIHTISRRVHVPAVDVHLAYSDDGGKTWHYQGPLWPSYADTDKGGRGEAGYTAIEVSNLLPRVTGSGVTWYGIRGTYFLPQKGGYSARPANSLQLVLSQASSPQGLATAPSATLGMGLTSPAWGIDTKLAAVSPDVSDCSVLNEPGLYFQGDTLYLVLDCIRPQAQAGGTFESVVVFSTKPEGDIHAWQWQYLGQLAGAAEERELGGNSLTQVDLSLGKDGQLLLVGSPGTLGGSGNDNHIGCKLIEVASLNPPKLARDTTGKLKVRAFVSATDLGAHGPGACAYDPASATGVIIVRRQAQLTFGLYQTGLNP